MKARGLEAWHGHLTKHLDIKTPSQLKALTSIDLRRMATAANMRLDQKTIDQVLQAIRRNVTSTTSETATEKARRLRDEKRKASAAKRTSLGTKPASLLPLSSKSADRTRLAQLKPRCI